MMILQIHIDKHMHVYTHTHTHICLYIWKVRIVSQAHENSRVFFRIHVNSVTEYLLNKAHINITIILNGLLPYHNQHSLPWLTSHGRCLISHEPRYKPNEWERSTPQFKPRYFYLYFFILHFLFIKFNHTRVSNIKLRI